MPALREAIDRWQEKVEIGPPPEHNPALGPCWLWTAKINDSGYGHFWDDGKTWLAHRWSYEHHVGPIPEGRQLDHLCRVRHCVRPTHLEPVTGQVNVRRGRRANSEKNTCKRGHPLEGDNLYVYEDEAKSSTIRHCRACRAEYMREFRAKKRAEQAVREESSADQDS